MGNEFVAEVDQELITSCGVEHDVTAAYNPRTNGLTERFNRTLCECLRKHADGNSLDWHMS
jgi:transposase InsO family protein